MDDFPRVTSSFQVREGDSFDITPDFWAKLREAEVPNSSWLVRLWRWLRHE